MKQTIEIEVPDGKKAVWKDGKIVFQGSQSWKDIKNMDAVIKKLTSSEDHNAEKILRELNRRSKNSHLWCIAAMKAVIWAITDDEVISLIEGDVYYPIVQFCKIGCENNCWGKTVLGYIRFEGKRYAVVGGGYDSSLTGLGSFSLNTGVSFARANVGYQAVSSLKQAEHISKYFGKILFTAQYGGYNANWEWIVD